MADKKIKTLRRLVYFSVLHFSVVCLSASAQPKIEWASKGRHRLLVRVEPIDIGARAADQMPAELPLEVQRDLKQIGRLDVASVQVIRYDVTTGKPLSEAPFRWYDGAIPYDYPEFEGRVAATNGATEKRALHPRWGHLYGTLGEWERGRLAWLHTQQGAQASFYAIYFDLLPAGRKPSTPPPQGFIGDAMERREPIGHSSTGVDHSRVAVADWNGDGLFDLLLGSQRGGILLYPNAGTWRAAKFSYTQLLLTTDGLPLDVGLHSAPVVVDWDGDGDQDLLTGALSNRLLFYENIGTKRAPKLVARGLVKADGKPLALPTEPNPEGHGVFKDDYYPVPEACDWDGDGDVDLLLGGYVTGLVYWFENTGRNADRTPILKARGALQADGAALDVGWSAAPTAADFDHDGDLDLIVGSWLKEDGVATRQQPFLHYFENSGSRTAPRLTRKDFPKRGAFPNAILATPRAVDFDHDGSLDLVVSAGENLYLYRNVGSKTAPLFAAHAEPLPSMWGNAPIANKDAQFVDWNGDGRFDLVTDFSVRLNEGNGKFSARQPLLARGERITHPAPMGDDYRFIRVADLDHDGRQDILFGDHRGHIYFHQQRADGFDTTGSKLMLTDGQPLKVGPEEKAEMDFRVLQGARTTLDAADFDRDGRIDLVVGDTFGLVRYFRNVSDASRLLFAPPVTLGRMKNRMTPAVTDWNGDGFVDVIGSSASGDFVLYLNHAGKFAAGVPLQLPGVPYWPFASVVDWNGDGDEDVMIATAYNYFVWVERSFLTRGYRASQLIKAEHKP